MLKNSNFLITGGNGFAAGWLISLLFNLFNKTSLPSITIVARNPMKLKHKYFQYSEASYVDWTYLESLENAKKHNGNLILLHTSVPASSSRYISQSDVEKFSVNTNLLIDFAAEIHEKATIVNLSSGGIYIRPKKGLIHESGSKIKDSNLTAYEQVKLFDENIIEDAVNLGKVWGSNPRLFSFTGPGFNSNSNFAIASFLHQIREYNSVDILGSPSSFRSYMSPVDMAIWLLKSSLQPSLKTLHIGSIEGYEMIEIVEAMSRALGQNPIIKITGSDATAESYVPDNSKTMAQLRIDKVLNLRESLRFWIDFDSQKST